MEGLANKVTSFFFVQGQAAEVDRDIYVYGLIVVFSTTLNAVVTMLIGFICGIPLQTLAYIVPFAVLRLSAGGFHAKSFWRCVAFSSTIQIGAVLSILHVSSSVQTIATMLLLALATALVFKLAPVEHSNRPLTPAEYIIFRNRARAIAVGGILTCGILLLMQTRVYPFCIALGMAVVGCLLLPDTLRKRGETK